MKNFEEFKSLIVESINVELNELKIQIDNLQNKILKNDIEIKEISKKINELIKAQDTSIDIFSPSIHNNNFNSQEIVRLRNIMEKLESLLESDKNSEKNLEEKISKKQSLISIINTYTLPKEELSNISELSRSIEKLKFCSKICLSDSNRCKLELDKIIKDLSLVIDENVSRETL